MSETFDRQSFTIHKGQRLTSYDGFTHPADEDFAEQEACDRAVEELNGYDYYNQAWVVNGKYVACSHPESMNCDCFGTVHAGQPVKQNSDVH